MRLISSNELYWVLGNPPRWKVHGWIQQGKIPNPNISGRPLRWTAAALLNWVETQDLSTELNLETEELRHRIERVIQIQDALKQQAG